MKKINLFCLPFAGGSKYSYRDLEKIAPAGLNIIPLEYPGRGSRVRESFLMDIKSLVDDVYMAVEKPIDEGAYAIYGHSLGGIVAFFLVKKIIACGRTPPLHLFATGTSGPASHRDKKKKYGLLSKKEFLDEVRRLDGLPEQILADEEMVSYFEPILRADFVLSETTDYITEQPFEIPITVITGTEEGMDAKDISMWQDETSSAVDFRKLPGKHFFIFQHPECIIGIINEKLNPYYKIV